MKILRLVAPILMLSTTFAQQSYTSKIEMHSSIGIRYSDINVGLLLVYNEGPFSSTLVSYISPNAIYFGPDFIFGDIFHINPCLCYLYPLPVPIPAIGLRLNITENLSLTNYGGLSLTYNFSNWLSQEEVI